jgi:hypothetical protein
MRTLLPRIGALLLAAVVAVPLTVRASVDPGAWSRRLGLPESAEVIVEVKRTLQNGNEIPKTHRRAKLAWKVSKQTRGELLVMGQVRVIVSYKDLGSKSGYLTDLPRFVYLYVPEWKARAGGLLTVAMHFAPIARRGRLEALLVTPRLTLEDYSRILPSADPLAAQVLALSDLEELARGAPYDGSLQKYARKHRRSDGPLALSFRKELLDRLIERGRPYRITRELSESPAPCSTSEHFVPPVAFEVVNPVSQKSALISNVRLHEVLFHTGELTDDEKEGLRDVFRTR